MGAVGYLPSDLAIDLIEQQRDLRRVAGMLLSQRV
jgi:hypothetical protein